jgi:hypothetical protein
MSVHGVPSVETWTRFNDQLEALKNASSGTAIYEAIPDSDDYGHPTLSLGAGALEHLGPEPGPQQYSIELRHWASDSSSCVTFTPGKNYAEYEVANGIALREVVSADGEFDQPDIAAEWFLEPLESGSQLIETTSLVEPVGDVRTFAGSLDKTEFGKFLLSLAMAIVKDECCDITTNRYVVLEGLNYYLKANFSESIFQGDDDPYKIHTKVSYYGVDAQFTYEEWLKNNPGQEDSYRAIALRTKGRPLYVKETGKRRWFPSEEFRDLRRKASINEHGDGMLTDKKLILISRNIGQVIASHSR